MTQKRINSIAVKVAGKVEIEQKLVLGQAIHLFLEGFIVQTRTGDNQDGSVDVTYVLKAVKAIVKEV